MDMENTNNKSCYIYCRVSTEEQANEGFSLDNQKRACIEYANNNSYEIKDYFIDEGKSGRTTDRPEFQRLLKSIADVPVGAVIVYKIDRFARNVGDFANIRKDFKNVGVKLLSVSENGDVTEGLIGNIFASVAEWESEVNGKRTKDALTQKFREGWWPGMAPHGYQNAKDENGKGIIVIDQEMGSLIKKWAFLEYSTGNYSLLKLTKILHKKGFKTKNGKPIAHSTIQQIISNPFYYGLMKWNGMEKTGNHVPLVSKKLFDLCHLVAAKHRNFVIRERKYDFLLRGIVYCSQCGQRYTAEYHAINSRKRDRIGYYHCAKLKRCKSRYVECPDLEKNVADLLKSIKFSKGFTNALTNKVRKYLKNVDKEEAKSRKSLFNKRSALINKRKILESRLYDETINRETFRRMHGEIQVEIDDVDVEVTKLKSSRKFDFDLLEEVLALTRNIPKTYKEAPHFLKRKYLNFFFDKIEVNDKKIVNTAYSPLITELINQQTVILRKDWLPR